MVGKLGNTAKHGIRTVTKGASDIGKKLTEGGGTIGKSVTAGAKGATAAIKGLFGK